MNSEFSPTPREELEAQITALLLGELPEAEAGALREKIAADPELWKLHTEIGMTIGLLKEAIASPEPAGIAAPEGLKISEGKREKLLASFKVVKAPTQKKEPIRIDFPSWGAIAAMFTALFVLAGLLLPSLAKSKKKALAYAQRSRPETEFETAAADKLDEGKTALGLTPGISAASQNKQDPNWIGVLETPKGKAAAQETRVYQLQPQAGQRGRAPAKADESQVRARIELPQLAPAEDSEVRGEPRIQTKSESFSRLGDGLTGAESAGVPVTTWAAPADLNAGSAFFTFGGGGGVGGRAGGQAILAGRGFYDQSAQAQTVTTGLGTSGSFGGVPAAPGATMPDVALGYRFSNGAAASGPGNQPVQKNDGLVSLGDAPSVGKMLKGAAAEQRASEIDLRANFGRKLAEDDVVLSRDLDWSKKPTQLEALPPFGSIPARKPEAKVVAAEEFSKEVDAPQRTSADFLGRDAAKQESGRSELAAGVDSSALTPALKAPDNEIEKLRRDVVAQEQKRDSVARAIVQQKESADKANDRLKITPAEPSNLSLMERVRGAERSAEIQIPKEIAQVPSPATRPAMRGSIESTIAQVATSYDVMKSVGEKLGLQQKWSESAGKQLSSSEVAAELQKIVKVEDKENGRLEIRAKGKDNKEAAQIANAVTDAVRQKIKEVNADPSAMHSVPILEVELRKQDEALAKKKAELRDFESKAEPVQEKPVVSNPAIPQPEVATAVNPFSTFSLNVSDVSFKLAAASLEKGVMPEAGAIRSEEFINAFDYRDPAAMSAPVAFAWERARYPFAHDRDLLRFSVKTAASGREAGRPLNLVLLLDSSGSMERADRVRIIKECFKVLAGQLQTFDTLSVVTFARTPRLWVDGLPGVEAGRLADQIGEVTPEGGTNLEEAMRVGYETAAKHFKTNGVNRVVLLTDGAANLGDVRPESLKKRVEENRKKGIALDCFGIGWEGLNDDLLEQLSRNGDGRYGFVNTPEAATTEFAGQLAGALKVAASDVKVQVEFNPKRATAYRQIGYAKHQLTKEQFRDNTVDAAEIGAAEAGNALYVVQVNPAGEGPIATVRVRFKAPGTNDYREHEWPVNYEGAATALEQSTATLRLAGAASAFSEWLAASPYAGEVTPDRLLGLMANIPEAFSNDSRPKQLEWMIRQAQSIAGK